MYTYTFSSHTRLLGFTNIRTRLCGPGRTEKISHKNFPRSSPNFLMVISVRRRTRTYVSFSKQENPLGDGKHKGGHLVFENPALPIPENSKTKHPTLILNLDFKEKTHTDGSRGSHSVFRSPALPIPENPKAEHPTPNTQFKIVTY